MKKIIKTPAETTDVDNRKTNIEKENETKSWLFENVKVGKPLRLTEKEKRQKLLILRSKIGNIILNCTNIKWIIH